MIIDSFINGAQISRMALMGLQNVVFKIGSVI